MPNNTDLRIPELIVHTGSDLTVNEAIFRDSERHKCIEGCFVTKTGAYITQICKEGLYITKIDLYITQINKEGCSITKPGLCMQQIHKEDCYKKTGLPWVLLNSAVEACTQTLRKLLVTNTLTTVPCGRCT